MFLELIATIFAGFAVAGVILLLGRFTGGRLPRWLAPVAAGISMIGVTISSEYGWYARSHAALPQGVVVAETAENRSLYRPWTYVVPFVERFVAIDTSSAKTHPALPGQYLTEVYFFGRWQAVHSLSVRLDCDGWRRAVVTSDNAFSADSDAAVEWISPPGEDSLLKTFCGAL